MTALQSIDPPTPGALGQRLPGAALLPRLSADQPGSLSPIALPQLSQAQKPVPTACSGSSGSWRRSASPISSSEIGQRRRRPADAADAPAGTKERLRAGIRSGSTQRPRLAQHPPLGTPTTRSSANFADRYGRLNADRPAVSTTATTRGPARTGATSEPRHAHLPHRAVSTAEDRAVLGAQPR